MLVSMFVSAGLTGAYFQVGSFLICRGLEQHDEAESRRITGFRQPVRCWRGASAGGPGGQRAGRWLGARRATSRPGLDTVWCARVEVCLRRKPPGSPSRGCPAPAAFVPHLAHTASEAGSQPGSFSAMPSTLAFAAVSLLAVQSGCGCISLQLSRSVNVRAKPAANTGAIVAGGQGHDHPPICLEGCAGRRAAGRRAEPPAPGGATGPHAPPQARGLRRSSGAAGPTAAPTAAPPGARLILKALRDLGVRSLLLDVGVPTAGSTEASNKAYVTCRGASCRWSL